MIIKQQNNYALQNMFVYFFTLISYIPANSQSIDDLFRMMPVRIYSDIYITAQQKEILLNSVGKEAGTDEPYCYIKTLDKKNGYLELLNSDLLSITMCTWNIKSFQDTEKSAKLIAVTYSMNDGGGTDYLDFFLYRQTTLFL